MKEKAKRGRPRKLTNDDILLNYFKMIMRKIDDLETLVVTYRCRCKCNSPEPTGHCFSPHSITPADTFKCTRCHTRIPSGTTHFCLSI